LEKRLERRAAKKAENQKSNPKSKLEEIKDSDKIDVSSDQVKATEDPSQP
jgi:hypothetical protein